MSDLNLIEIVEILLLPYISFDDKTLLILISISIILALYSVINIFVTKARKIRNNSNKFKNLNLIFTLSGYILLLVFAFLYYLLLLNVYQPHESGNKNVLILLLKIGEPIFLLVGTILYKVGMDGLDENDIRYAFSKGVKYLCMSLFLIFLIIRWDNVELIIDTFTST